MSETPGPSQTEVESLGGHEAFKQLPKVEWDAPENRSIVDALEQFVRGRISFEQAQRLITEPASALADATRAPASVEPPVSHPGGAYRSEKTEKRLRPEPPEQARTVYDYTISNGAELSGEAYAWIKLRHAPYSYAANGEAHWNLPDLRIGGTVVRYEDRNGVREREVQAVYHMIASGKPAEVSIYTSTDPATGQLTYTLSKIISHQDPAVTRGRKKHMNWQKQPSEGFMRLLPAGETAAIEAAEDEEDDDGEEVKADQPSISGSEGESKGFDRDALTATSEGADDAQLAVPVERSAPSEAVAETPISFQIDGYSYSRGPQYLDLMFDECPIEHTTITIKGEEHVVYALKPFTINGWPIKGPNPQHFDPNKSSDIEQQDRMKDLFDRQEHTVFLVQTSSSTGEGGGVAGVEIGDPRLMQEQRLKQTIEHALFVGMEDVPATPAEAQASTSTIHQISDEGVADMAGEVATRVQAAEELDPAEKQKKLSEIKQYLVELAVRRGDHDDAIDEEAWRRGFLIVTSHRDGKAVPIPANEGGVSQHITGTPDGDVEQTTFSNPEAYNHEAKRIIRVASGRVDALKSLQLFDQVPQLAQEIALQNRVNWHESMTDIYGLDILRVAINRSAERIASERPDLVGPEKQFTSFAPLAKFILASKEETLTNGALHFFGFMYPGLREQLDAIVHAPDDEKANSIAARPYSEFDPRNASDLYDLDALKRKLEGDEASSESAAEQAEASNSPIQIELDHGLKEFSFDHMFEFRLKECPVQKKTVVIGGKEQEIYTMRPFQQGDNTWVITEPTAPEDLDKAPFRHNQPLLKSLYEQDARVVHFVEGGASGKTNEISLIHPDVMGTVKKFEGTNDYYIGTEAGLANHAPGAEGTPARSEDVIADAQLQALEQKTPERELTQNEKLVAIKKLLVDAYVQHDQIHQEIVKLAAKYGFGIDLSRENSQISGTDYSQVYRSSGPEKEYLQARDISDPAQLSDLVLAADRYDIEAVKVELQQLIENHQKNLQEQYEALDEEARSMMISAAKVELRKSRTSVAYVAPPEVRDPQVIFDVIQFVINQCMGQLQVILPSKRAEGRYSILPAHNYLVKYVLEQSGFNIHDPFRSFGEDITSAEFAGKGPEKPEEPSETSAMLVEIGMLDKYREIVIDAMLAYRRSIKSGIKKPDARNELSMIMPYVMDQLTVKYPEFINKVVGEGKRYNNLTSLRSRLERLDAYYSSFGKNVVNIVSSGTVEDAEKIAARLRSELHGDADNVNSGGEEDQEAILNNEPLLANEALAMPKPPARPEGATQFAPRAEPPAQE